MVQRVTLEVRTELANEFGVELSPEAMQEVLDAVAHAAGFLGGSVVLEVAGVYGIIMVIDEQVDDTDYCSVGLIKYIDEDDAFDEEAN